MGFFSLERGVRTWSSNCDSTVWISWSLQVFFSKHASLIVGVATSWKQVWILIRGIALTFGWYLNSRLDWSPHRNILLLISNVPFQLRMRPMAHWLWKLSAKILGSCSVRVKCLLEDENYFDVLAQCWKGMADETNQRRQRRCFM